MMGSWGAWGWLALGFGLIAIEMLVLPGGFPLWIGLAALVMAGVTALFAMGWQAELIVFGLLSVLASVIAWKVHYHSAKVDAADGMNDRLDQIIGQEFTLDQGTEEGAGRIRVDDTVWRVTGPKLATGTRVRVKAADGATLLIEKA